jgi:hypothetical protein
MMNRVVLGFQPASSSSQVPCNHRLMRIAVLWFWHFSHKELSGVCMDYRKYDASDQTVSDAVPTVSC